jgi:hypothetical protein
LGIAATQKHVNNTLIQSVGDYPRFAWVSLILLIASLFSLYPFVVVPEREHIHIMSSGMTQPVTIGTSSWKTIDRPKSRSYENSATFYFQVDGIAVSGTAIRTISSKDKAWDTGKTVTLHYLDASSYALEGDDKHENHFGAIFIYAFGSMLFCLAMMPFFFACPRDEHERSILGETRNRKLLYMPPDLPPDPQRTKGYAEIQALMRAKGLASVIPVVTYIPIPVLIFCSTKLAFGIPPGESPNSYLIGAFVSAVIVSSAFWLSGYYLKRGKHADTYAYVLETHVQIRDYRRTKRSMVSKGLTTDG